MTSPASSEDDFQTAQPPAIAKVAGGVALGAGALAVLVLAQTVTGFWVRSDFKIGLVVLAALGVADAVFGLALMRARAWAAIASAAGCAALFLGASIWLFVSLRSGLVSLFALGAPPLAFVAAVLAAIGVAPCRRASAARARLAAQGLDMGT